MELFTTLSTALDGVVLIIGGVLVELPLLSTPDCYAAALGIVIGFRRDRGNDIQGHDSALELL